MSTANFAPSPPQRHCRLTVRLTESELQWVDHKAAAHKLSRSDLVREVFAGRVDLDDRPEPSGPTTDVEIGR